jgi:tetratricopeptide (TPR) repeat protein
VFDREIAKLKERVAKDPKAAAASDDLRDLERERKSFELEEYQRRVRERPTELDLWYELGVRLADVGKTDGAIEAFQHSIKDPKKRLDSLVRLGSCFVQKGLFDLAKKQLTTALQGMNATSERQKEVLYELGSIAEMSGQKGEAVSWFGKIYEVDIGYRDVAKKIDQLKSQ